VIADTDLVVIAVWWQVKYGRLPSVLSRTLRHALRPVDRRYLVPKPSIPWEPDPLRENPTDREALHARYVRFLRRRGLEYVEIEGDRESRLRDATAIVAAWLSSRAS
jgi:nicotinamide riboside kinase